MENCQHRFSSELSKVTEYEDKLNPHVSKWYIHSCITAIFGTYILSGILFHPACIPARSKLEVMVVVDGSSLIFHPSCVVVKALGQGSRKLQV